MKGRLAPVLYLAFGFLVFISSAIGTRNDARGRNKHQLRIKRNILETRDKFNSNKILTGKRNALESSLLDRDKDLIKSGEPKLSYDSSLLQTRDGKGIDKSALGNRYRKKRSTNDNYVVESVRKINSDPVHHNVERKEIPGDLFPETVIHNLEQTSDKVESDMMERKSKITERKPRDAHTEKVVYNLGEELSVEVPLTTKVHETRVHTEGITKRNVAGERVDNVDLEEQGERKQHLLTKDKITKSSGFSDWNKIITRKSNSTTRRDEVPFSGRKFLNDNLDDGDSNEAFQVKDKSADLEIHADSTGVKVKAKPASLQVVSNPRGAMKTLPGETHLEGVTAERRTFTPLLPDEEEKRRKHRRHHRRRFFHGLEPSPFLDYPFLGRRHRHRRHHRLPWLRHRQHINYPDIFERMRDQSPIPDSASSFSSPPSFGSPFLFSPPMSSPMMNYPSAMLEGAPGMRQMAGGAGMNGPMMPQLMQRSPTVETNPANRFGVPESPMGEMPRMPSMGQMGDVGFMGQIGPMGQMMNSMSGTSPMSSMQNQMSHKSNALEFWGTPNQDQLKALARGENVQRVLGTNQYGENLGGIMGNMMGDMNGGGKLGMMQSGPGFGTGGNDMGMNMPGGMNPGMGGSNFNFMGNNGMGNSGMIGQFGTSGTTGAMFNSMSQEQSGIMGNPVRGRTLFKKDDINKTEDYKKGAKNNDGKSRDKNGASGSQKMAHESEKFEKLLLNKAKSLVAGDKHIAKDEHTPLLREHRIRKSSKSLHDDEKRSLPQDNNSKKSPIKPTKQKTKTVKGSKKDVAVQRPPIIYHPAPEVYHRPDIVVHRPPVLFHRPPIVYHQAPVVIHRPAVVYRQPPIVFHQPYPVVNQPYYKAWDNFFTHPVMSHVGSNVFSTYNYLGVPQEMTGYRKGVVPAKPENIAKKSSKEKEIIKKSKRGVVAKKTSNKENSGSKETKVLEKKKKDVVVNRPPIIYHPPPEVYHRPEIVVHRAPLLIRRPPIVYHQPAVIVHRPPVVYHQPPIIFHQPVPTVNQPVLYSHDNFVVHPSFFATHHGSIVSDAGQLLGMPNTVSVPDTAGFPFEPAGVNPGGLGPGGLGPGSMGPIASMGRRKRSLKVKKKINGRKHENARRKNSIMVKRPPIVYHPPPEVYHRPDIVVHRAPIIIHRGPIVYHQPPVVVHRPSVVYHQPPVLFHQAPPMVVQPMFQAHDVYTSNSALGLVSSSTSPKPSYAGPSTDSTSLNPFGKSVMPKKTATKDNEKISGSVQKSKEPKIVDKDNVMSIVSKEISGNYAKVLARFFSHNALDHVSVRQLVSVLEDRKIDKNGLNPIIRDSRLKKLTINRLAFVEDFLDKKEVDAGKLLAFLSKSAVRRLPIKYVGSILRKFAENLKKSQTDEMIGSKKAEISKSNDDRKAHKKNAVLVKRPPIVYHPPPEVYHRPDIVVHRAPLVIHRAPLVYHQPPVVVHRPAVVYHQPPVLFHQPPPMVHQPVFRANDMYHETTTLTQTGSTVSPHSTYIGVPSELLSSSAAYGKSQVPAAQHKRHFRKNRRSVPEKDKTEKASKKNAVLVKRPPIIYHPPPEVYHRPDIVVHRAPIVIHRAPLVYHQPPVIVHRPAVVYHQPAVVFHQPPPVVHQPLFTSHDAFTSHDTLTLGGSSTSKVGDFLGPPPETLATRKETVPRHKDVPGTHRSTIERTHKEPKRQSKKDKKANPNRRSRLRKLILSLQKGRGQRKDSGLQTLMFPSNPIVLPRPPLVLQRPPLVMTQPMMAPVVQRVLTPVPVVQQVIRPVGVPVVYHHHHWPVHIHHHHLQPVVIAPRPVPVAEPHVHYTDYYHSPYPFEQNGLRYNPLFYGKSFLPKNAKTETNSKKQQIDVYDYGVPAHGHVGHVHGHSHVVNRHGYVIQHADCPKHCGLCYPNCPSDCAPHCVKIVHHQHHRPRHIFVDHQHYHHLMQTHLHQHQWPVHHFDVHHGYPRFSHRHLGVPLHSYRRREAQEDPNERATVPHYVVYQQVKHWHPPCLHHDVMCHHHHHPSTVYHEHQHPVHAYHHHHYHPYPVYHHHEHITPVVYHHVKPYPVNHHHDHYIHETWHHDNHHFHPPVPYPVPSPPLPYSVPVPIVQPYPVCMGHLHDPVVCRSHVRKAGKPSKKSKISPTPYKKDRKNKKKDVVVNRPPIIYHPPPEVYHRPEIVVHRAPVLIHRPPIVYHQSSVIVHRPPVVYHQPPVVFHQPSPTVNQPILYSHDNFIVHPAMFATHAGTMVESAGHFLGLPSGPIANFPQYSPYAPMGGFGSDFHDMAPYATPLGRRRRSTNLGSKKPDRKNSIVVHRPPVVYHPPPEIYHRPSLIVHRPDVLIHRPPIVYHQPPVVLHRPPVVYHQTPIVFHQPPPMINQPMFHSHDAYMPHPVFTHYDSDIHHVGSFYGVPHYGEDYHGFHGGFGGFHGLDGGFHGYGVGFHGYGGGFRGFGGGFGPGFGRSKVENAKKRKTVERKNRKDNRVLREVQPKKGKHERKSLVKHKNGKSQRAHRKHSVMVNRPPVIFHPAPEVFHRPPYVMHQPDIVIHRPPVIYHQAPVVVHHPPVAYHQPPIMFSQHHPIIVAPSFHHHISFQGGGCINAGAGCFGGGFHGYPFLYGKSQVSKPKLAKHSRMKSATGSKKHDIVMHRPPLVYHPPPEIYHRPDIVVHRPDVLVHRPSIVYDQPSVVLHRPAVVYHEPPVVFHQPPPFAHLPVYHADDIYAPHPVYTQAGSHFEYHHNVVGTPEHVNYGPEGCHDYFGCPGESPHAYGKSKIEKHAKGDKKNHKKKNDETKNAHKRYHLMVHRPPIVYHPPPTVYHRPDVVVHQPDIVIHRPSVVMHPSPVIVHKPAVVYHEPPVVFHQPPPAVHQPLYHSHDAYAPHPAFTHVGSEIEHEGNYLSHPDYHSDYHQDVGFGFDHHVYPYGGPVFPGFGKSKIQKSEKQESTAVKEDTKDETPDNEPKDKKENSKMDKRDTTATKVKRVQYPRIQEEKTVTGTKKNAIVVRRPPIVYHPPPEVYHRPDIVVHRAPIVIQRAPLVYHQAPVIVHRPAVVYHQPAVVFHQPPPAVHQPVFHSVDNFDVHPHLRFSQAASTVQQVGNYIGIPDQVMHRSNIARHNGQPVTKKHRRALLEKDITPITPLNFFHRSRFSFEQPRSNIPYPSLHALHPYSLSYASFPWGGSSRRKRYIDTPSLPYSPPSSPPFPQYGSPYTHPFSPHVLRRPHVNVNIETVKSKVPGNEPRLRRQLPETTEPAGQTEFLESAPMAPLAQQHMHPELQYQQESPYSGLPRQHVNVNIDTIKSTIPPSMARSRRQVLAGLPLEETQPNLAASSSYPGSYTFVSNAGPPMLGGNDDPLSISKDLVNTLYGGLRETRSKRPKVSIVVQTAKSEIPTSGKNVERKSVVPEAKSSLKKMNVDAFNTMPEVTTIEPPLLRDGVRVNMVDLGDPTAENGVSFPDVAPGLPIPDDGSMQRFGNMMGPGAQGDFGVDKWKKSGVVRDHKVESQKKSSISEPNLIWKDQNAEKKSDAPVGHRGANGKKRYSVTGYQTPAQFQGYQGVSEMQESITAEGQPESAGYSYMNSVNTASQPNRGHINVNIETVKNVLPKTPKRRAVDIILPRKRQLIGTIPLVSLVQPNPNSNTRSSLKSTVPNGDTMTKNNQQPLSKRQAVMGTPPVMQVIPQLRHAVSPAHPSRAKPVTSYPAFAINDAQPTLQVQVPSVPSIRPDQSLFTQPATAPQTKSFTELPVSEEPPQQMNPTPVPYQNAPELFNPWSVDPHPHVNINVETIKSKIPGKSNSEKIITPRFKRDYPVLYNVIKAKAKNAKSKIEANKGRSKRQIPFYTNENFFQDLIPDANELAKRAFYNNVPAGLSPRAFHPARAVTSPQKVSLGNAGAIEVGGADSSANPASLLKSEFSENFDDIAKIQRQEVNAIRGMNSMTGQPRLPLVSVPEEKVTPTFASTSLGAPATTESPAASPLQQRERQSVAMPLAAQQLPWTFNPSSQNEPIAGQPDLTQLAFQPSSATASLSPPAIAFPSLQFQPSEFPLLPYPPSSFIEPIPHQPIPSSQEEDRPSVKIQVQTSKSSIPKLIKKKLEKRKHSQKHSS